MLTKNMNLPGWEVIELKESEFDCAIHAKYTPEPQACIRCGVISQLYRHGIKRQRFMDLPVHNKQVGLIVHRQRYLCRACKKTSFQPLPDMNKQYSMTNRLLIFLLQVVGKRNKAKIAKEVGISERTIGRVLASYPHFTR